MATTLRISAKRDLGNGDHLIGKGMTVQCVLESKNQPSILDILKAYQRQLGITWPGYEGYPSISDFNIEQL